MRQVKWYVILDVLIAHTCSLRTCAIFTYMTHAYNAVWVFLILNTLHFMHMHTSPTGPYSHMYHTHTLQVKQFVILDCLEKTLGEAVNDQKLELVSNERKPTLDDDQVCCTCTHDTCDLSTMHEKCRLNHTNKNTSTKACCAHTHHRSRHRLTDPSVCIHKYREIQRCCTYTPLRT